MAKKDDDKAVDFVPPNGSRVIPIFDCPEHGTANLYLGPQGEIGFGHSTPMRNGEPIAPGATVLSHKNGIVEDTYTVPGARKGPAKVVTKAYRDGYDRTFKKAEIN